MYNSYLYLIEAFKKNTFTSSLYGEYNLNNIAAAISFGYLFDIPLEAIKKAISAYRSTNYRSQEIQIKHTLVLMDAYNANPSSMKLALEAFEKIASDAVGDKQIKNLSIVKSRSDAIQQGLMALHKKNILVILGKGHERTMEENGKSFPFNDREYILGNIST